MTEWILTITYHARDEGSRKRPLKILDEGSYGNMLEFSKIEEEVYRVTFSTKYSPEEVLEMLRSPSEGGVFVLEMLVNEKFFFVHRRWKILQDLKRDKPKRKKKRG